MSPISCPASCGLGSCSPPRRSPTARPRTCSFTRSCRTCARRKSRSRPMSASRTPENVLRRLEWTVIRRLDGLLHGDYRTLFRGYGLDLADLREYQYHDDVRHIDWNVTARLQTPYVREFNEEREVAAWFLLDLSPSVDFGSREMRKRGVENEFVTL